MYADEFLDASLPNLLRVWWLDSIGWGVRKVKSDLHILSPRHTPRALIFCHFLLERVSKFWVVKCIKEGCSVNVFVGSQLKSRGCFLLVGCVKTKQNGLVPREQFYVLLEINNTSLVRKYMHGLGFSNKLLTMKYYQKRLMRVFYSIFK